VIKEMREKNQIIIREEVEVEVLIRKRAKRIRKIRKTKRSIKSIIDLDQDHIQKNKQIKSVINISKGKSNLTKRRWI
jgi:hypothetical protein